MNEKRPAGYRFEAEAAWRRGRPLDAARQASSIGVSTAHRLESVWRKREKERDDVVERLHQMLAHERYDELLGAATEAVARFPRDPEVRLMHGTALVWSRPEDAPRELATAVSLSENDPWLVVRAANLLFHLGEDDAVRAYISHAESLPDENGDLVGEIAFLRHKLDQADR